MSQRKRPLSTAAASRATEQLATTRSYVRLTLIALAAATLFSRLAFGSPEPAAVSVASAAYAGSGCPARQNVDAKISDDFQTLSIGLPPLEAQTGGAAKHRLARSNCELVVTLKHSPGFQVAPVASTGDVAGRLAKGAVGMLSFKYHFQGGAETPSAEETFDTEGPLPRRQVSLKPKPGQTPCKMGADTTTLVLSYALRLVDKGAAAEPSELKADGLGTTTLAWRACK